MSVPYLHWSAAPLTAIRSERQIEGRAFERLDKPNGLWFSAGDGDDGWRAWCEGEEWNLAAFQHCTEIVLAPTARLLRVASAAELDALTSNYGVNLSPWRNGIDWRAVAETYDAIVIAPYIWSRRLHDAYDWYDSWDCASGCVWNGKAVERLIVRDAARVAA